MLAQLGPLTPDTIGDLRPYLHEVPDPRARQGRWYPLTAILLICACAAVSGAITIDELAEWAQRAADDLLAALGVRPHPLGWRRGPSRPAIDRVLVHIDSAALDAAVGAYLDRRGRSATGQDGTTPPRPGAARSPSTVRP